MCLEFVRNDIFDARNFFAYARPPYKQNQFGGNVGGPILKNKLFFFGGFRSTPVRSREYHGHWVCPHAAELGGDFTAAGLPTIYDPSTYNATTGTMESFAQEYGNGNRIPASDISPFVPKFNQFIPAPNTAPLAEFAGANLIGATRSLQSDNKFDVKVDYDKGEKDRVFGRFSLLNSAQSSSSILPDNGTESPMRSRNAVVSWTHTFGPSLVNEARVGLDRVYVQSLAPSAYSAPDFPTALGLYNLNSIKECNEPPGLTIAGYSGFGGPFPWCVITTNTDKIILDNLSWVRGRHRLIMGGQMIRVNFRDIATSYSNGIFTFTGQFSGSLVADYLLGDPDIVGGGETLRPSEWRAWWPDLVYQRRFSCKPPFDA